MDFRGGYSIIRGLGELPSGAMISQEALTAIHWLHRNFAFILFAYLGTLAWRLRAVAGLSGPVNLMLALLLAQLFTGLTTILFQWPLLIAVLHNGGAAGLVLTGVTIMVRLAGAGQPSLRVGSTRER
jgi:cytochrome c oxidase assembly protein subunit 15